MPEILADTVSDSQADTVDQSGAEIVCKTSGLITTSANRKHYAPPAVKTVTAKIPRTENKEMDVQAQLSAILIQLAVLPQMQQAQVNLETNIKDNLLEHKKCVLKKVGDLMNKQEGKYEDRFKTLENQMRAFSDKSFVSPPPSGPPSVISGHTNLSTVPTDAEWEYGKHKFAPSFFYIQGFCANWQTRVGALREKEVDLILKEMLKHASEQIPMLYSCIDEEATMRKSGFVFNTRIMIRLKPETDNDDVYALRDAINSYIGLSRHSGLPKEATYCAVEAAPWRKPYRKLGGMACNVLSSKGCQRQSLKPEFGPPVRVYEIVNGIAQMPEMVKHDQKSGWQVMDGDRLKRVCNFTPEEFLEAMKE